MRRIRTTLPARGPFGSQTLIEDLVNLFFFYFQFLVLALGMSDPTVEVGKNMKLRSLI
jgi:hypothetical protein